MKIEKKIKNNVSLADYTTFQIGGPAKYFLEISNKQELKQALLWAEKKQEKIYILGGGSNVLINDDGLDGLVIKIINKDIKLKQDIIIASAGAIINDIILLAKDNNLSGLEWAYGIPGTIGGAVRGNIGAYGESLDKFVLEVEAYNRAEERFVKMKKEDCAFGYRDSIFKHNSNLIIWQVKLKLSKSKTQKISALMEKYLQARLKAHPHYPSAGCVFKNLIINKKIADKKIIQEAKENKIIKGQKLGCGYIVDRLGLKGKKIGGALISPEHGNFIVNYQKATAQDVQKLIKIIKQEAKEKLGLDLEEEVQCY